MLGFHTPIRRNHDHRNMPKIPRHQIENTVPLAVLKKYMHVVEWMDLVNVNI